MRWGQGFNTGISRGHSSAYKQSRESSHGSMYVLFKTQYQAPGQAEDLHHRPPWACPPLSSAVFSLVNNAFTVFLNFP